MSKFFTYHKAFIYINIYTHTYIYIYIYEGLVVSKKFRHIMKIDFLSIYIYIYILKGNLFSVQVVLSYL